LLFRPAAALCCCISALLHGHLIHYGWSHVFITVVIYSLVRVLLLFVHSSFAPSKTVLFGVPQGWSWDQSFFYSRPARSIVETHGLLPHLYADDTHTFGSCCPGDTAQLQSHILCCAAVSSAASNTRQPRWGGLKPFSACSACSVRNLGIRLDSDLSMNMHITWTVSCSSAVRRQTRYQSFCQSVNPSCGRTFCRWLFHGCTMV